MEIKTQELYDQAQVESVNLSNAETKAKTDSRTYWTTFGILLTIITLVPVNVFLWHLALR